MFVAVLFIPAVAGNVFMESSFRPVPEITGRRYTPIKTYTLYDPCNTNKPGNRTVSCSQIQMMKRSESGVYKISPRDNPVDVECDMESGDGGWTVIQRRNENETADRFFEKNYKEYESGFGTIWGGFWIGLENLHALTTFPNNQQGLRIELTRTAGEDSKVVYYNKFHVGSKEEKYKLTIDEYQGPDGYDALSEHNGAKFTIKYGAMKYHGDSCSLRLSGGWWFNKCSKSNLNGLKFKYTSSLRATGITWYVKDKIESYYYTYHKVEMKIRDADFGFCTGALKS